MIRIGQFNRLRVSKLLNFGAYLTDGNEEILMPTKFLPEDIKDGDSIRVFLYHDNEGRPIATTQIPYACVNQVATLKVVANGSAGGFLDWGLDKDLLVPNSEQRVRLSVGQNVVVWIYVDDKSGRIVATTKLNKFIKDQGSSYKSGDEVEVVIAETTNLGYKVVVDNEYWGLLFKNEVFKPIEIGDRLDAYIKEVRPDGKLDITLHSPEKNEVEDLGQAILKRLEENNGTLPFGDKSDADIIYREFGVSKKVFKRTLGMLFKEGKITLENERIIQNKQ
ncbi:S1-like domain-containing RNA-binding protein [uncultured Acetobacteroides sp.]|uniref:CvfB family protein n=1 Tax=uncultured Acetobacteroides sp. TaxID=1760811 RepID=UPI0029F55D6D|nr:S1-like domain-containing RNA-binding protein [uncultured Acetobacteroides sp.]